MSAERYKDIARHAGHDIEVVFYGRVLEGQTLTAENAEYASVECTTCYEALVSADNKDPDFDSPESAS